MSSLRLLSLVSVLGVGALLTGCPQPAPSCLPSNCSGCCTATGECVAAVTPQQCGAGANACTTCQLGQICLGGFCAGNTTLGGGVGSTGGGTGTGGGSTTGGGSATGGGDGTTGGGSATGGGDGTTGGGSATGGGDGTTGGGVGTTGGGVGTTGGGVGTTGGGVGTTGGGVGTTGGGVGTTGGGVGTTGGGVGTTGGGVGTTGGGVGTTGGGVGTTGGGTGTTGGGTGTTGGGTGTTTSAQIAAVRAAATSSTPLPVNLAVSGALVTYLKPLLPTASPTTDPAGFFIQAEPTGPALFVRVDAATYGLATGDRVDLAITEVTSINGLAAATQLNSVVRTSMGNSLAGFSQNVSGIDFSNAATGEGFESELVSFTGTFSSDPGFGGNGYLNAFITTAGSSGSALRLRIPEALQMSGRYSTGCTVTFTGGVVWRYLGQVQASAWNASELVGSSCPTPRLVGATALSNTAVRLTFNRPMEPSSLLSNAVTIPGLTVSAVTGMGSAYTVTTSAQTPGASYTATVATTAYDTSNVFIDGNGRTASFTGYLPTTSGLVINEVNYDSVGTAEVDEFIELYNAGTSTESLADRSVVLVNGNGGTTYLTIDLSPAGTLAPGEFLVIGSATTLATVPATAKKIEVPNVNSSGFIQNGAPDGLALVSSTTFQVFDSLSYEGMLTWLSPSGDVLITEGASWAPDDNSATPGSLSRVPNGVDTNQNGIDFVFRASTPGTTN